MPIDWSGGYRQMFCPLVIIQVWGKKKEIRFSVAIKTPVSLTDKFILSFFKKCRRDKRFTVHEIIACITEGYLR